MAQSVQIILEDDLEGGPADRTIEFGLDGKQYEIDLSQTNAEKLRDALRPFVDAGRKATSRSSRSGAPSRSPGRSNPNTAKIREWAKANGYEVSDRGRIHQSVQDAYYAAN